MRINIDGKISRITFEPSDRDVKKFMNSEENRFLNSTADYSPENQPYLALRDILVMSMYELFAGRSVRYKVDQLKNFIPVEHRKTTVESVGKDHLVCLINLHLIRMTKEIRMMSGRRLDIAMLATGLRFDGYEIKNPEELDLQVKMVLGEVPYDYAAFKDLHQVITLPARDDIPQGSVVNVDMRELDTEEKMKAFLESIPKDAVVTIPQDGVPVVSAASIDTTIPAGIPEGGYPADTVATLSPSLAAMVDGTK